MQSITQGLSVTYEAKPSSVAAARTALGEFAEDAGATDEQIDAVRLAASEAVTNAVLHAYRGGTGEIQVTAALAERELWILVADEGPGMQPRADRPGLGLGLGVISQVCDDMAIVPRSSGGTEVRILFKLSAASEHSHPAPRFQRHQSRSPPATGTPAETCVGLVGPAPAGPVAPLAD
jgi:serine/threonine-protein kinase RsbW